MAFDCTRRFAASCCFTKAKSISRSPWKAIAKRCRRNVDLIGDAEFRQFNLPDPVHALISRSAAIAAAFPGDNKTHQNAVFSTLKALPCLTLF